MSLMRSVSSNRFAFFLLGLLCIAWAGEALATGPSPGQWRRPTRRERRRARYQKTLGADAAFAKTAEAFARIVATTPEGRRAYGVLKKVALTNAAQNRHTVPQAQAETQTSVTNASARRQAAAFAKHRDRLGGGLAEQRARSSDQALRIGLVEPLPDASAEDLERIDDANYHNRRLTESVDAIIAAADRNPDNVAWASKAHSALVGRTLAARSARAIRRLKKAVVDPELGPAMARILPPLEAVYRAAVAAEREGNAFYDAYDRARGTFTVLDQQLQAPARTSPFGPSESRTVRDGYKLSVFLPFQAAIAIDGAPGSPIGVPFWPIHLVLQ